MRRWGSTSCRCTLSSQSIQHTEHTIIGGIRYGKRIQERSGRHVPAGFKAAGVKAGIKKSGNLDVAVIYTEKEAVVAGTFTQNAVAAAPVFASKAVVATGTAHAIVANAGCANACTGEQGAKDAKATQEIAAKALGCDPLDVIVASTGVIGVTLPMDKMENGVKERSARSPKTAAARRARPS